MYTGNESSPYMESRYSSAIVCSVSVVIEPFIKTHTYNDVFSPITAYVLPRVISGSVFVIFPEGGPQGQA